MQREMVTTFLDVVGVLLLAAGLTGFLWQFIGPTSFAPGGALVLLFSFLASRRIKADDA